jgi:hypothetical protein
MSRGASDEEFVERQRFVRQIQDLSDMRILLVEDS